MCVECESGSVCVWSVRVEVCVECESGSVCVCVCVHV